MSHISRKLANTIDRSSLGWDCGLEVAATLTQELETRCCENREIEERPAYIQTAAMCIILRHPVNHSAPGREDKSAVQSHVWNTPSIHSLSSDHPVDSNRLQ